MGAPQSDKMQKSWLLDPRRKTLEHFVELALVIAALTLTGAYLNMGIRPTRSEIMIIPIVRRTPIENRGNRFQTIRKLMRRQQLRRESNPSSSSATNCSASTRLGSRDGGVSKSMPSSTASRLFSG